MARKVRLRNPALKQRAAGGAPDVPPTPHVQSQTNVSPGPAEPKTVLPQHLLDRPQDYRFFQAARLLQLLQPERASIGRFEDPSREAVRFSAHQTLGYPASEIQSLEVPDSGTPKMSVNFLGVTGPVGELPVTYTAYVTERLRAGDKTAAEFFDLFNHRLTSLFYRSWEKYHFQVPYERGEDSGLSDTLLHFVGLGTPKLQNRQDIPDEALKFYAGLLSQQPRSAIAMQQILTDYFDVPVEVVQFVGSWRKLDPGSLCLLDDDPDAVPAARLGQGAVAGDEVWDQQSTMRLRIGPLTLDRYREFLPDGVAFPALRALARFISRDEYDFEVQLVLKREEAPGCLLGAEGEDAPQLSWLSWIKSKPMDRDPDDTVYRLWEVA
ncbi:type VI secretion system baseplate subunit TssG [Paludibaculum fermentans]|uniref:type VI secretion system baseplate subunit TssG n=1 Tax=Paludibaculum fermentans TaxID=1473598 RepID=UPI003EBCDC58